MSTHINRLFRRKDTLLREWFLKIANDGNGNSIGIIRQALTCLRLFGSVETAQAIKAENENLKVLLAFMVSVITWDQLCKFFDLDPDEYTTLAKVDDIRQAAIEAGMELAR